MERGRSFGPTQGYQAYLTTKVDIGPLVGDLTLVFTVLAIAAVALAARTGTRDPAGATLLCLLAATVTLAYAWIVHVPAAYFRMAYFLPLALVPLVAAALVRLLPARAAAVVGGGAALVIAAFAWPQAEKCATSTPSATAARCAVSMPWAEPSARARWWSRTAAGASRRPGCCTRTLAALEPEDIQPSAERRARQARAVLDGTPAGLALARRLGVRFLVVDPTCADARERPTSAEGRSRGLCRSGWWCCGCPGLG